MHRDIGSHTSIADSRPRRAAAMGAVKKNCDARDYANSQGMLAAQVTDATYVLANDSVKKVPEYREQSALRIYSRR